MSRIESHLKILDKQDQENWTDKKNPLQTGRGLKKLISKS